MAMPPDVKVFGPRSSVRATFEEIERFVDDLGPGAPRPTKVEVNWWTLSLLKKEGDRRRDAEQLSILTNPLESSEERVARDLLRAPVPVWVDPALANGELRVYWVKDDMDRLASGTS